MRVGFFTFRIAERPTGLAKYAIALSSALRDLDAGVEIVLLNPHPESDLSWYRDFPTYALAPAHGPASHWLRGAISPMALAHAGHRLKLDIVHAPANVAPFVGPPGGVKRVVTVHDVAPLVLPGEHRPIARLGYRAAIPVLRWTADAVLTVSQAAARDLLTRAHVPAAKISVIPNGTDLPAAADLTAWRAAAAPSLGLDPTTPYVLTVGDIRPRKNLLRIVEAICLVAQQVPDVRLVIAGQSMHRSEAVTALVQQLGPRVVQVGYVDEDLLHRLYAGAAAFLGPSLHEGFGLPALEAMAHGTPVVASSTSAMPEVVGDAGLLVDPYDVHEIARATIRILTDHDCARELSRRGRERAGMFTWRTCAQRTLAVYNSLLSAGQVSR